VCTPACATTSKKEDTKRPEVGLSEINPPPDKGEGAVLGVTATTDEDVACLRHLELPVEGGYFLSDAKLKAAVELRLYAEDTYVDATLNNKLCKMNASIVWDKLAIADEKLKEVEDERSSWWYQNKGTVFTGLGFILGASTTILIVYGVNKVSDTP